MGVTWGAHWRLAGSATGACRKSPDRKNQVARTQIARTRAARTRGRKITGHNSTGPQQQGPSARARTAGNVNTRASASSLHLSSAPATRGRWPIAGLPAAPIAMNMAINIITCWQGSEIGMRRREFLGLTAAMLIAGSARRARGGEWPERPVKLILPYAPGGATDLIGRPWADKLAHAFGQPFVIENRGGASGIIGTEAAAMAAPDGYTLLLTPNAPLSVQPRLRKTPYDPLKNFTPVARVGDLMSGFVINPAVGVRGFNEMVGYAKANPGKLAYGSAGLGTASHLRLEMLKLKA